jgi:hypothetical protein
MELKGRIIQALPEQSGQSKAGTTWKKQDFILETQAEYPKKVSFSLWGEKIDQFKVVEGEEVTAHIDVESREFNGRWYTDVKAWKIEKGSNTDEKGPITDDHEKLTIPESYTPSVPEPEDDLPF